MKVNSCLGSKQAKVVLTLCMVGILTSCSGEATSKQNLSIRIDGSSTVYPITKSIVEQYRAMTTADLDLTVDFSGTGAGFEKFCAGETEINNASRPITKSEIQACEKAGIAYIELPIAFDALTVVVNPENDWIEDISVEQLYRIWSPEAEQNITRWNQVRPEFPDRPLNLYAPGTESGTFDYFTLAIVGESGTSRTDYLKSEDDNVLVQGIQRDPNALGYIGSAYYESNKDNLKAIGVESGKGAVLPSRATVEAGIYQPLSRPLFIYVQSSAAENNSALQDFIALYFREAPKVATQVGYVPLPQDGYQLTKIHFLKRKLGSAFKGQTILNLTIGELLNQ